MKFEQDTIKKINLFEKDHQDIDLIKYARIICRNTVEREVIWIFVQGNCVFYALVGRMLKRLELCLKVRCTELHH